MAKPYLALQPSEATLVQAAAQIYSAYVAAGSVSAENESDYLQKAIALAVKIARTVDENVQADAEVS